MKDLRHHQDSRTTRPALLAVSALVAAAALGGTAGPAAAHGPAHHKYGKASHQLRHEAGLELARLYDGLLAVEGTNADDRLAVRLQAGNPAILQVDLGDDGSAELSFPRAEVERLSVDGGNGDDSVRIDESNGVFTDSIDGNKGNDVGLLGNGNDTFVWDPGDGSDVVEGQNGTDTMLFNGADASERVVLSANGGRLRFFRDPGGVTMDTDDVEIVDFKAFGGADAVFVGDLGATDVRDVKLDLAGAAGGGDGQQDRVVVDATDGNDRIDVSGDAGEVKVGGLAATVEVVQPEVANDRLEVNTLAGTDAVSAGGLAPGTVQLFVDGVLQP